MIQNLAQYKLNSDFGVSTAKPILKILYRFKTKVRSYWVLYSINLLEHCSHVICNLEFYRQDNEFCSSEYQLFLRSTYSSSLQNIYICGRLANRTHYAFRGNFSSYVEHSIHKSFASYLDLTSIKPNLSHHVCRGYTPNQF